VPSRACSSTLTSPYRAGFNQAPWYLPGARRCLPPAEKAIPIAALDGCTPQPLLLVGARDENENSATSRLWILTRIRKPTFAATN
jgi:hypothetical protein